MKEYFRLPEYSVRCLDVLRPLRQPSLITSSSRFNAVGGLVDRPRRVD